ncbi:hypothetical protein Tco_0957740 [Tanacetum coccineum]
MKIIIQGLVIIWTGSLSSGCVDLTGDEDPTDEDGDIGMGYSTGVSVSLGGEIFSGGKKCQELNIGDGDNTGDGGKIVGGVERIFKKRTKNEAKTTKPDSEWKSRKRQSQNPRPSLKKSTQVNPEAKSQEI